MSKTRKGKHTREEIDKLISILEPIFKILIEKTYLHSYNIAGSYRRGHEVLGDLDIVLVLLENQNVELVFNAISNACDEVLIIGSKKLRTVLNDIQIDFLATDLNSLPFAMTYFTGDVWNNIRMRKKANKLGYTLNEYGLFTVIDNKKIEGLKTEEDIYNKLGLKFKSLIKKI